MTNLTKAFTLSFLLLFLFACEKEEVQKDYSGEYAGITEYKSNKRYYSGPIVMIDTVFRNVHIKVIKGKTKGTWTMMVGDDGSPLLENFKINEETFSNRRTDPSTFENIINGRLFEDSLKIVNQTIIHNNQWFTTATIKAVKMSN